MSLEKLQTAMKSKKLVFGVRETIKNIRNAKAKVVFLASNCGQEIEADINHYAKTAGVEVIKLDKPRAEISVFCKKNFPVSVISY